MTMPKPIRFDAVVNALKELDFSDYKNSSERLSAIACAVYEPYIPSVGWTCKECDGLRDSTVELLSECMPDEMDDDDLEEMGLMRLPTDEHGKPIHVDDEVECNGAVYIVESLEYFKNYGWIIGCVNKADTKETRLYAACICRHHQTIEDVLREFAERYLDYEGISAAGRRGVGEALMSEYVTRLREVMQDD